MNSALNILYHTQWWVHNRYIHGTGTNITCTVHKVHIIIVLNKVLLYFNFQVRSSQVGFIVIPAICTAYIEKKQFLRRLVLQQKKATQSTVGGDGLHWVFAGSRDTVGSSWCWSMCSESTSVDCDTQELGVLDWISTHELLMPPEVNNHVLRDILLVLHQFMSHCSSSLYAAPSVLANLTMWLASWVITVNSHEGPQSSAWWSWRCFYHSCLTGDSVTVRGVQGADGVIHWVVGTIRKLQGGPF